MIQSPVSFALAEPEPCNGCPVRVNGVCSCLEDDDLASAADLSRRAVYRAGQTLAAEDHEASDMQVDLPACVHNVRSGVARLARTLPDGRRQIVGFALPGDFIGLDSAAAPRCAVEAVTDMSTCVFSRQAFQQFAASRPHVGRRLHELTLEELASAREQMVLLGRRTAEERLAFFLMAMARRWRRGEELTSLDIPLPMSRRDIADYLGLTVETVSRTFTRLARSGVFAITPAGVHVPGIDRLGALVDG